MDRSVSIQQILLQALGAAQHSATLILVKIRDEQWLFCSASLRFRLTRMTSKFPCALMHIGHGLWILQSGVLAVEQQLLNASQLVNKSHT